MPRLLMQAFKDPVAVEEIRAHAGIDIGDTLIGMHLKKVAVPVRIEQKTIGFRPCGLRPDKTEVCGRGESAL